MKSTLILVLTTGLATMNAMTARTATSTESTGPDYTLFELGNPDVTTPTTPGLLLMGGGGDVDEAIRWFIQQAGGGDIVVLRAGGGDGYQDYFHSEIGGINSVTSIVFDSEKPSSDPAILDRVAKAEGIFIAGGDQARYYRFWAETPLAAAITKHHADGKPLGGTSAGLAVLGGQCYSARNDTVISKEALADPFDDRVTLDPGMFDIPIIDHLLTDSHFSQRDRLGRLVTFVGRLRAQTPPIELIGVGVDERTALCVEADGTAKIISPDEGTVTLVKLTTPPKTVEPQKPLEAEGIQIQVLPTGTTLDVESLDQQFENTPTQTEADLQ